MFENEEQDFTIIKTIICSILLLFFVIIFTLFTAIAKVDASSYYFDYPRVHKICVGAVDNTIACTSNSDSTLVNAFNPGLQKGNYITATYRADMNINNVLGSAFNAGNYSVSFDGYFTTISGSNLDTNIIKARLLYYPTSSNAYGYATCDNGETFNVSKSSLTDGTILYKYSYNCETLQVTEGKTFLGFEIGLDLPSYNTIQYIDISQITTNLTLIGEGEATNNDIINNQNQNTDKVIGAIDDLWHNGSINDTPVDGSLWEEYNQAEQNLLIEDFDVFDELVTTFDSTSSTFIWELVTGFLKSNSLVFTFFITILSFGVVKLVLNR